PSPTATPSSPPRRSSDLDEAALARALKEKWVAGAALDVYEKEPLPADSPLRDPEIEDRCRLYPHFASAARITRLSKDPNKGMARSEEHTSELQSPDHIVC